MVALMQLAAVEDGKNVILCEISTLTYSFARPELIISLY